MGRQLKQLGASSLILSGLLAAGAAHADRGTTYYVSAPVVDADPIVETRMERTAHEECRPVRHRVVDRYEDRRRQDSDAIPTLVGGLIGGVIGRQFGGGSGRDAMTVVGALAGAGIANSSHSRRDRSPRYDTVERCVVTHDIEEVDVVTGWNVTYLYQGHELRRVMQSHPGSHVRVQVQLEPMAGNARHVAYRSM